MSRECFLIIFDCDGTLVDSEYLNNLATCELLAEQGLPQYDMEYAYEHFVGRRLSEILKSIAMETGHVFPADIAPRYIARTKELTPEYLKPVPGARDMVRAAAGRGKICVVSNGQKDNVLDSLRFAELLDYFPRDCIFTGLDAKNPKPAPDLFLLAAQKTDVKPEHALVIEDSVVGTTGGVAAGMEVWGFSGTHHSPETQENRLLEAGAARVFRSLIHMREFLEGEKRFSPKTGCAS